MSEDMHRDKIGHVVSVEFVVPARDHDDAVVKLTWVLRSGMAGSKIKYLIHRESKK